MATRPWQAGYEPDPRVQGAYAQAGRRPSQTRVTYRSVGDLVAAGDVPEAVFRERTLDRVAFPVATGADGVAHLDVARVTRALRRRATLSTVVQSRALLAASHDAALDLAGLNPMLKARGDFKYVDFRRLVGRLLPVWGPAPHRVAAATCAPFAQLGGADDRDDAHAFAFRPVVLATVGDGAKGDQGEIVAQGVTVTARAFNFCEGDPGRVHMGGGNPVFEDTCAWVLVTHAYDPPLEYARLNKESMKKRCRDDDDPYERVFRWEAYRRHNRERLEAGEEGYAISSFGLLDTKQTGKDVARAIVSWPVAECAALVAQLEAAGLEAYLRETPMRLDAREVSTAARQKGGMDLRRMLLVRLLLRGTPLEALWTGDPLPPDLGLPPCRMPGTAAHLHARLRDRRVAAL